MIHIFFVPGMFGSTVEYALRNFTTEMKPTGTYIGQDGSMHGFKKMNHPASLSDLVNAELQEINTPIYPFNDKHLPEILESYPRINNSDKYVLIYCKSFEDAELNLLFQYYKICACGTLGIEKVFHGSPKNAKDDVSKWNPSYTKYSDLKAWEFREWFSIFYPTWITEWQESVYQVPQHWFKISSGDILHNTEHSLNEIIGFCNLTKSKNLNNFVSDWKKAQQYILDEYQLIHSIVDSAINQELLSWKQLHIIAEAIIQQKLRIAGYEICCDGLDVFPTNSLDLYKLLEKRK